MKNQKLKVFNSIRVIAQRVNNPLFQEEYKNIMLPLLNQFKQYGNEADNSIYIDDELKKFIKAMQQKSITFQYVPYQRDKRTDNDKLYQDHNKLYQLEMICNDLLR